MSIKIVQGTYVVNKGQPGGTSENKTTKPVPPSKTRNTRWEEETHAHDKVDIPSVLPPHDFALAQVGDISNTGLTSGLQDHPTDMGPPETFVSVVGVKFGVGITVVSTVTPRPPFDGTFDGAGTRKCKEVFQRFGCIVRAMCPEAMVPGSNT